MSLTGIGAAPGLQLGWEFVRPPATLLRTDVAGFVGTAPSGPLHQPVRLTGWSQYQAAFGGHDTRDWLGHAVHGYFANGGAVCWVVRVANPVPGVTGLLPEHLLGGPADRWGLAALDDVPEVRLIAVPTLSPRRTAGDALPEWSPAQRLALQIGVLDSCARHRRFAVLDVPAPDTQPDAAAALAARLARSTQAGGYGCLTYPWITVADPQGEPGDTLRAPACGHVLGILARVDRAGGVQKAPANEVVAGALDTACPVDARVHGRLNDAGVDAIVVRPSRGVRLMGARTLSADPVWRYTNVRRLVSVAELALESALAPLVFEPRTALLAAQVEREARAVLTQLWRGGALAGERQEDAIWVRCGEETTTPDDRAAGRLICLVGLRPPAPAEFVVLRLAVSEGGVQVLGEQGRGVADDREARDAG